MKITLSEELDLEVKEEEVTVGTETKPEELEEKAREVVNPVYANAIKQMSNMDKIRQLYSKMQEKAPEHDENPKRPTMHASAKKMRLDESLFESEYFFDDDEEGYCPSCGSSLDYEGPRFEDTETAYYNCTCPNCGKHFKEVHEIQLVFSHYEESDNTNVDHLNEEISDEDFPDGNTRFDYYLEKAEDLVNKIGIHPIVKKILKEIKAKYPSTPLNELDQKFDEIFEERYDIK